MFLSKHSNGRYYVYFDLKGKRHCKSTGCRHKKDALRFLVNFKINFDEQQQKQFTSIRLREFQFYFFRYAESFYTPKTCQGYKVTFNFLIKHFGNVYLEELTKVNLENYLLTRIRDTSLFAGKKDYAHLSSALNKAIQDGFLLTNPLHGIRRIKTPQKLPLFFTKDELRLFIDFIDNQDIKDLTIIAVNTGLRQKELLTLEWNQINFDEKYLILDNRIHITKGKRVRTIPINKTAVDILQKRFMTKKDITNLVFTYNDQPIKQDFLTHKFKKYILRSGINPKLNFHSLRHTFASYLVQAGVSIYTVSKLLGHSDIKTTEIYSHLRREDLRDATDKLDIVKPIQDRNELCSCGSGKKYKDCHGKID